MCLSVSFGIVGSAFGTYWWYSRSCSYYRPPKIAQPSKKARFPGGKLTTFLKETDDNFKKWLTYQSNALRINIGEREDGLRGVTLSGYTVQQLSRKNFVWLFFKLCGFFSGDSEFKISSKTCFLNCSHLLQQILWEPHFDRVYFDKDVSEEYFTDKPIKIYQIGLWFQIFST